MSADAVEEKQESKPRTRRKKAPQVELARSIQAEQRAAKELGVGVTALTPEQRKEAQKYLEEPFDDDARIKRGRDHNPIFSVKPKVWEQVMRRCAEYNWDWAWVLNSEAEENRFDRLGWKPFRHPDLGRIKGGKQMTHYIWVIDKQKRASYLNAIKELGLREPKKPKIPRNPYGTYTIKRQGRITDRRSYDGTVEVPDDGMSAVV